MSSEFDKALNILFVKVANRYVHTITFASPIKRITCHQAIKNNISS